MVKLVKSENHDLRRKRKGNSFHLWNVNSLDQPMICVNFCFIMTSSFEKIDKYFHFFAFLSPWKSLAFCVSNHDFTLPNCKDALCSVWLKLVLNVFVTICLYSPISNQEDHEPLFSAEKQFKSIHMFAKLWLYHNVD